MIRNRFFVCYMALAGSFSYNIQTICSDKPTSSRSTFSLGYFLPFGCIAACATFVAASEYIYMKHERLCKDIEDKFCLIDTEPFDNNPNDDNLYVDIKRWRNNQTKDPEKYLSATEKMYQSWFVSSSLQGRIKHYYEPVLIGARRQQIAQRLVDIESVLPNGSSLNAASTHIQEISSHIDELQMMAKKLTRRVDGPADVSIATNRENEKKNLSAALVEARSLLADARRKQDLINRASNFSFRNKNFLAALTHRMPIGALDENRLSHQVKPEDDVD